MAYYAALISLEQTIERLLDSSNISISFPYQGVLQLTRARIVYLLQVLKNLERSRNNISDRVDCLHAQIREAAYKLEDVIQSHVSDRFLSRPERHGIEGSNSLIFSLDINEGVKQEIRHFINTLEKVEHECNKQDLELSNLLPEKDDADSLRNDFGGMESEMVGLSDEFSRVKKHLLTSFIFNVFSICGMAGIGKTIMARKIYQDPDICNYFTRRLWVTIGQKYQLKKIMLDLLAQLDHDVDTIQTKGDEELGKYLYASLESGTYLIIVDDVWNKEVWVNLKKYLPFNKKSQVLLITRLQHIAKDISFLDRCEMRFLNKKESWCLLRGKVFGEKSCPPQLEKVGAKIAKKCDGLPLLIVTVADLLSKVERSIESWSKIADGEDMSIFTEANDKIFNILLRSYKYLPQDLKACFLFMGVFPPKCKLPASKLYNFWIAEDFSTSIIYAKGYLDELVSSNVVLAHKKASIGGIKTCSLHPSFWHACTKQAWNEKFLHVLNRCSDSSKEGAINVRRLGIYNNVLFGIKEVYNSIKSISGTRSLICSGPNHQYPIPICFSLRLLKVLDVLSVRFYTFPTEVLKVIHLRYLALTYNGNIPSSISKLWNLEVLIVRPHLRIKFPGNWSYLPVEIWNLKKLRHLQVMGSCLPYLSNALLINLEKLSDVSVHSCNEEIFKRIPFLKKLGIQIELAPDPEAVEPLSCFDYLSHLNRLESLTCVIVNPNPARPPVVIPPASITNFPSNLRKLSLSGFGYSWEYIQVIGKLQNLRVLKLRSYAFRGSDWIAHMDDFQQLHYLLLEDMDLVYLRADGHCFPNLHQLIIKHCYKLKEIPLKSQSYLDIELVDSPLAANYVQKNQSTSQINRSSKVHIHSSWKDGKLKA